MASTTVGVVRERGPGEKRVALTPDTVRKLHDNGTGVLVESGAGAAAWFGDDDYRSAGAEIMTAAKVYADADTMVCVAPPAEEHWPLLREGQQLVGLLEPLHRRELVTVLRDRGVTAISLDLLPRRLSRAQTMDALSSQANIAGYKAAVLAADTYGRYFPMLTTAAGTSTPATVLVLGTGVAGLSAIGTARRLGAVVTAYDVRPESRGEVESLGARFLVLDSVTAASGEGGYARALTESERETQQAELTQHIGRFDVVITTARVPGRRPPVLVTRKALDGMRPGSVVVDMAAGELGGNVETSVPDRTVQHDGVAVIGAGNLPSTMAPAASTAYARNIAAMLAQLAPGDNGELDLTDEVLAATVVTAGGALVSPAVTAAHPAETDAENGEEDTDES